MTVPQVRHEWRSLAEALSIFALIMLYIWRVRLSYPWSAVSALGLVIATHFLHGETPERLGFAWKNFRCAFPMVMPWVAALSSALLAGGLALGTVRETKVRQTVFSIAAYTIWGLFQQYLLNGYFVNRLEQFQGSPRGYVAPLAAGVLFSLVHLPNWFLMPVTLVGGYICARVYQRHRSLYVLALAHGIVGFVLFIVVPDQICEHFIVGPRYLLRRYHSYPEFLL